MPGAQLRIHRWPIPATLLSLNSINSPPSHRFVFWKFVENVLLPINTVTTSCNAAFRYSLGIVEKSVIRYCNDSYLKRLPIVLVLH